MNIKGFGLIMILIVVAIIAILTVSGFYFSSNSNQALKGEKGADFLIDNAGDAKSILDERSENLLKSLK